MLRRTERFVGDWSDLDGNVYGYTLKHSLFVNVNVPASTVTSIRGINAKGTTAGVFGDAEFVLHGFAGTRGDYIQLDFPAGQFTFANRYQ
jgi:hypothetical protein